MEDTHETHTKIQSVSDSGHVIKHFVKKVDRFKVDDFILRMTFTIGVATVSGSHSWQPE